MNNDFKKVMIFGVFDGLHDGHKFLIEKALGYSANLYIVLAPTRSVKNLKGKLPSYSILERTHAIQKAYPNVFVIEGDEETGIWTAIGQYKPDIIICGYDQDELYTELEKIRVDYGFELHKINENYGGLEHHSRFLNKSV